MSTSASSINLPVRARISPSQFPRRHLVLHSVYPKASSRHFELCLKLGYGTCMRLGLRGIRVTPLLARRQPLGALVLPASISPVELVYPSRALYPPNISLTVSLACRPRLLARRRTVLGNGTIRNRF
jgi:hypothetical protein